MQPHISSRSHELSRQNELTAFLAALLNITITMNNGKNCFNDGYLGLSLEEERSKVR